MPEGLIFEDVEDGGDQEHKRNDDQNGDEDAIDVFFEGGNLSFDLVDIFSADVVADIIIGSNLDLSNQNEGSKVLGVIVVVSPEVEAFESSSEVVVVIEFLILFLVGENGNSVFDFSEASATGFLNLEEGVGFLALFLVSKVGVPAEFTTGDDLSFNEGHGEGNRGGSSGVGSGVFNLNVVGGGNDGDFISRGEVLRVGGDGVGGSSVRVVDGQHSNI